MQIKRDMTATFVALSACSVGTEKLHLNVLGVFAEPSFCRVFLDLAAAHCKR